MRESMNQTRDQHVTSSAEWWNRYMEQQEKAGSHKLRVYVRSLRPAPGAHEQRTEMFERLQRAENQDCIDTFDIRVTGNQLCLCDRCDELAPGGTVREELLELLEYADGNAGVSGFERRHVDCTFTDEEYPVLVPPETALGVYLDGSLTDVLPCVIGGTQYSIDRFLGRLVGDLPPAESSSRDEQPRHLLS